MKGLKLSVAGLPLSLSADYDGDSMDFRLFNSKLFIKKSFRKLERFFKKSITLNYQCNQKGSHLTITYQPISVHLPKYKLNSLELDMVNYLTTKDTYNGDILYSVQNEMESTRTLFSTELSKLKADKRELYRKGRYPFLLKINNQTKIKLLSKIYI